MVGFGRFFAVWWVGGLVYRGIRKFGSSKTRPAHKALNHGFFWIWGISRIFFFGVDLEIGLYKKHAHPQLQYHSTKNKKTHNYKNHLNHKNYKN